MTLGAQYLEHLRAPRSNAQGLAAALGAASLDEERECYRAWTAHATMFDDIAVSAMAPASPALGERWFDVCELALMVNIGRAWLSTRPTARWQMHGFLAASNRAVRDVQVVQPYVALDPVRLTPAGDELARCTELTTGEASLYAGWFGKYVPHQLDWQSALEWIPSSVAALGLSREWVSNTVDNDEAANVTITPATIEVDPDDDPSMMRGEFTRDLAIGFRGAVSHQGGVATKLSSFHWIVENVKLLDMCDRARFA